MASFDKGKRWGSFSSEEETLHSVRKLLIECFYDKNDKILYVAYMSVITIHLTLFYP